eukprot:CAMPEP_0202770652 /NCGR_PEP_ID=MMETSP1388-20130828/39278_1 /ASSEMBLY_ACC=CAM_ASM_000864 /TAXON_ID=37098 /ORGANISM="Isochrysis sp, Strain CCMP1244" /LENGTH=139 /DNA_ID=CAMNT_0049439507 /DNA_START=692 /DNA_END=1110 /DNA_ORIENTATION=-
MNTTLQPVQPSASIAFFISSATEKCGQCASYDSNPLAARDARERLGDVRAIIIVFGAAHPGFTSRRPPSRVVKKGGLVQGADILSAPARVNHRILAKVGGNTHDGRCATVGVLNHVCKVDAVLSEERRQILSHLVADEA